MIEVKDLSRRYGTTMAVREISFDIQEGDIFGFIGPNGAGKTTTIKVLATLLRPSLGTAMVNGLDVRTHTRQIRKLIGYMPDYFGVYEDMRVEQYLEFFAAAYGVPKDKRRHLIGDILDLVDLAHMRLQQIAVLSQGTKQRLGLARVLVHDPKVLLLDEPASGLDPRARIEIRELIKELGKMGKTILVSSHILSDLADICNRVGIIEKGRMVFSGPLDELYAQFSSALTVKIQTIQPADDVVTALHELPDVETAFVVGGHVEVALKPEAESISIIPRFLVNKGFDLISVKPEELNLEDAFMRLTKGIVS